MKMKLSVVSFLETILTSIHSEVYKSAVNVKKVSMKFIWLLCFKIATIVLALKITYFCSEGKNVLRYGVMPLVPVLKKESKGDFNWVS